MSGVMFGGCYYWNGSHLQGWRYRLLDGVILVLRVLVLVLYRARDHTSYPCWSRVLNSKHKTKLNLIYLSYSIILLIKVCTDSGVPTFNLSFSYLCER